VLTRRLSLLRRLSLPDIRLWYHNSNRNVPCRRDGGVFRVGGEQMV